ncbi:hypothetical protein SALBM311S_11862 [Streptomyces alboniger]
MAFRRHCAVGAGGGARRTADSRRGAGDRLPPGAGRRARRLGGRGRLLHDQRVRHHPAAGRRVRPFRPHRPVVVLPAAVAAADAGHAGDVRGHRPALRGAPAAAVRRGVGGGGAGRGLGGRSRTGRGERTVLGPHGAAQPHLVPGSGGAVLSGLAASAAGAAAACDGADRAGLGGGAVRPAGALADGAVGPHGGTRIYNGPDTRADQLLVGARRPGPTARRRPPTGAAAPLGGTTVLAGSRAAGARSPGRSRSPSRAGGTPCGSRSDSWSPQFCRPWPRHPALSDLGVEGGGLLPAGLAATVAAALASYLLVERPLLRRDRVRVRRLEPVATAARPPGL